jgi:hypothetical protein
MGAYALIQIPAGPHLAGAARASPFVAVPDAAWRAVIAGRNYTAVFYNYRRHLTAQAVTPCFNNPGNVHEIIIPAWPFERYMFHNCKISLFYGKVKAYRTRRNFTACQVHLQSNMVLYSCMVFHILPQFISPRPSPDILIYL